MSEQPSQPDAATLPQPGYLTFVLVWLALVVLTGILVLLSHFGPRTAVWGLLTISPLKAGLVFYYFMHLKYEGLLLKAVMLVALVTLLIFLTLLFADVAFA
jgi:cytochrome c oxidase subunit IV